MKSAVPLIAAVAVARGSSFIFSKQLLDTMKPLNLLGTLILHEPFGILSIIGAILIIAAIVIHNLLPEK